MKNGLYLVFAIVLASTAVVACGNDSATMQQTSKATQEIRPIDEIMRSTTFTNELLKIQDEFLQECFQKQISATIMTHQDVEQAWQSIRDIYLPAQGRYLRIYHISNCVRVGMSPVPNEIRDILY